jgi:8-oxo-dGTP diphosphatase
MYSIFTNVYLKKGNQLRLLHRAPNKAIWPDALLGIGGKVEPGEDIFEAAKREFCEEAGVELLDLKLVGTLTWLDETNQNGINYIFTATQYEGQLVDTCDEGTFEWVDVTDALLNTHTAAHQLKYLPYIMSGQHFSQHLLFKGPFSEGQIVTDHNSQGYTNHRLAKKLETIAIATSNAEKLQLVTEIMEPYEVQVAQNDNGISIDVELLSGDPALNDLLQKGIRQNVEQAGLAFTPQNAINFYQTKITDATNLVLAYQVTRGDDQKSVLIPARLTNTPHYSSAIASNFFWSFVTFNVNNEWVSYIALTPEQKQDIFSLLAQSLLEITHKTK